MRFTLKVLTRCVCFIFFLPLPFVDTASSGECSGENCASECTGDACGGAFPVPHCFDTQAIPSLPACFIPISFHFLTNCSIIFPYTFSFHPVPHLQTPVQERTAPASAQGKPAAVRFLYHTCFDTQAISCLPACASFQFHFIFN